GVLGAAGTLGTIAAALGTGVMAAANLALPFFVGSVVIVLLLGLTLAVGGAAFRAPGATGGGTGASG
ncbi:MAG TPA: hypothetical protein VLS28_09080, partial [Candidatus Sulfomarinibacteraceae bacterium]|nr:hypothetical protein [Candidatus Sulfomarinibacteraceae bacterium]